MTNTAANPCWSFDQFDPISLCASPSPYGDEVKFHLKRVVTLCALNPSSPQTRPQKKKHLAPELAACPPQRSVDNEQSSKLPPSQNPFESTMHHGWQLRKNPWGQKENQRSRQAILFVIPSSRPLGKPGDCIQLSASQIIQQDRQDFPRHFRRGWCNDLRVPLTEVPFCKVSARSALHCQIPTVTLQSVLWGSYGSIVTTLPASLDDYSSAHLTRTTTQHMFF